MAQRCSTSSGFLGTQINNPSFSINFILYCSTWLVCYPSQVTLKEAREKNQLEAFAQQEEDKVTGPVKAEEFNEAIAYLAKHRT